MAPQPLDKIESAPGNGMASVASNPQHLVRGRAAGRARLRLTSRENDQISVLGKLQKKAPNTLKSLDAELKSAPALGSSSHPTRDGGAAQRIAATRSAWARTGLARKARRANGVFLASATPVDKLIKTEDQQIAELGSFGRRERKFSRALQHLETHKTGQKCPNFAGEDTCVFSAEPRPGHRGAAQPNRLAWMWLRTTG